MNVRMLLLCLLLVVSAAAYAGHAPLPPKNLDQRVGFDQHLGGHVPMGATFRSAAGKRVSLRQLAAGKPLLLSLGYFRCPNLCDVTLAGMAHTLAGMKLRPGTDFQVAFVSIDPKETPADARHTRARLAAAHPGAHVADWHFLTGGQAAIHALADAVGFRYLYDPRNDQYAHAAGLVVVSPAGKIAQYFFGVSWPSPSVRLALVQASHGKVGSLIDQVVLLCCGYDPATGRYSLVIGKVMRVLGLGFAALLLGWLGWMARRRRARA